MGYPGHRHRHQLLCPHFCSYECCLCKYVLLECKYVGLQDPQHVSSTYRQQYFEGILYQKTDFFDDENNSSGTLTARVGGDPKQLEELLGTNMALVYTACVIFPS